MGTAWARHAMCESALRKSVAYESDVSEGVQVTVLFYIKSKLGK
jgi:hypothetical protein